MLPAMSPKLTDAQVQKVLLSVSGASRQEVRRAQTIHRRKFMDGRMTPEEAHQRYGIPPGAKCQCGARPLITCRILMPLDELVKRDPQFIGKMLLGKDGAEAFYKLCVETVHGTYVRVSTVYACKMHEKDLDHAAAQAPSWCIAEFNRGPGAERVVVGGPLALEV